MVKLFVMAKRKKGITLEECLQHWRDFHAPLIAENLPGIKRYVQNHAVKLPVAGEPPFDGMAELWLDDLDAWHRIADFYMSDRGEIIREDEEKFLDLSTHTSFVCEEIVVIP